MLTTTIVAPPSNASKWQMGFNSAFKGLIALAVQVDPTQFLPLLSNILKKTAGLIRQNSEGQCIRRGLSVQIHVEGYLKNYKF